ncbi:LOW QUALITY PROTEIN: interferon-related developmental regulator 2-like [Physella acuta]|uniref:LOW QUALITY PROTEIN: interferon-related developmental regulator 2-like n=1 Tax=Physella acuta TaxID=109671 RepID=UPI0027DD1B25|nr:LOW QUALITY PROTEIN: interferon-related developmental regulator 2-like [Physella acuta]
MPKNKNIKKRGGGRAQEGATQLQPRQRNEEDDESLVDQWSTQSVLSDDSSWPGSDPAAGGEESSEDTSQQDLFEDKFTECMDGLLEKSAKPRITALQGIQKALQKKYVAEYLLERKETLSDSLVKCLRKGKGEEQELAAACLSLVAVQLGSEASAMYDSIHPVLTTLMTDNSTHYKARGACAITLATCCFLCSDDLEKAKALTKTLEDMFSLGYGKGENSPSVTPEQSWLMCQALSAWCLLLTISPQYEVQTHINNHLGSLQDLLKNSDVDLRITAGEAIALLYELARDSEEDFEHEDEESLCELLKQLATDSVKHRAKKDRRHQRSCFRDVQRYVVDIESPNEVVKLGKENLLELSSWSQKRQYDSFCHVLMTGTLVHMKVNPILRDMFDLGAPGLDDYSHTKSLSKAQRTFINAAAFKARTKARAKHRDKRAVTVNAY